MRVATGGGGGGGGRVANGIGVVVVGGGGGDSGGGGCCIALKRTAGLGLRCGRGSAVVTGDILPDESLCCRSGEDAGVLLLVVVEVVRFMSLSAREGREWECGGKELGRRVLVARALFAI